MIRSPSRASRRRTLKETRGGFKKAQNRFTRALTRPLPRTVASVDPIATRTLATSGLPTTNIADGVTHEYTGGLIRYVYGKPRLSFSNVYLLDQLHRNGTDPTFVAPYGIEVVYTGRKIEFALRMDGQRVHVFVDNVLTKATGYLDLTSDTGFRNYMLDFGSAATRRIRLVCNSGTPAVSTVRIESAYALLNPAPVRPANLLIVGDSFHEPSFPTYAIGGIPCLLSEQLGVSNIIPAASGGTGFVNDAGGVGAGKCNFAQRVAKEVTLSDQFDAILFCASGNDQAGQVSSLDYATNVNTCLATARAAWPQATIMAIGPAFKEAGGVSITLSTSMEMQIEAACRSNGCIYIPGMAAAMGALSDATRNSYFHEDGHPNDAGHVWIAETMNRLIRAAV